MKERIELVKFASASHPVSCSGARLLVERYQILHPLRKDKENTYDPPVGNSIASEEFCTPPTMFQRTSERMTKERAAPARTSMDFQVMLHQSVEAAKCRHDQISEIFCEQIWTSPHTIDIRKNLVFPDNNITLVDAERFRCVEILIPAKFSGKEASGFHGIFSV